MDCHCTCRCHHGNGCPFPPDSDGLCTACGVACLPAEL